MSMSPRVLAVLAVLSLAACPEHAPAWYGLTDEAPATTGDLDGGDSFPTTSATQGPDVATSTDSEPTPTTGDWTSGPASATTTSGESTGAPVNEPPTVALALSPEIIEAAGVVELSIEVSPDVVELDVLYRGEVVATLPPADFPYHFEVTSQAKCDGSEGLSVVARDAEGLMGDDAKMLACSLPASGSEAYKVKLPGETESLVYSVAVLADGFVAAGVLDGQLVVWRVGPDLQVLPGWPRVLADWTAIPGLAALESAAVGVTVDAEQNIIIAGNTVKAGVKTYYVAKLNAAGSRLAETQGMPEEEAAGVAVTAEGVIVVAGAVRTATQPPAYDWRVWGYAKLGQAPWVDTLPLGPGEEPDVANKRSEHARAVVVLPSGELLVVGEREYQKLDKKQYVRASWQRYNSNGVHVGDLWTSDANGTESTHDAANAVVALPGDEFAISGWGRATLGQSPQVWSRRFQQGAALDFRVEPASTAEAKGIGHDREGNLVVATTLTAAGQLDAWTFAFRGWALPAVWSQPPYGDPQGWDGYTSIACTDWGYCLEGGFLTVGDQLTGFLRLHNP